MGTRSTYRVVETHKNDTGKDKKENICLMYVQYDGYPSGHPLETAEWLSTGKVVNGIGLVEDTPIFNGAGCLAAQLVAKFKDGPGGAYMYPMNSRGDCGEDYLYDIIVNFDTKEITYTCTESGWGDHRNKKVFSGTPQEFINWVKKTEEDGN